MGDYYFSLPHNIANDLKIIAYFKLPRTRPDIQPTGFLGPDIRYSSGYSARYLVSGKMWIQNGD